MLRRASFVVPGIPWHIIQRGNHLHLTPARRNSGSRLMKHLGQRDVGACSLRDPRLHAEGHRQACRGSVRNV